MRTSSYPYLASQTPFPGESGDKKVVEPKEDKIIMMVKTQGDAWSLLRPPFSLPPPCHCCLHSLMYSKSYNQPKQVQEKKANSRWALSIPAPNVFNIPHLRWARSSLWLLPGCSLGAHHPHCGGHAGESKPGSWMSNKSTTRESPAWPQLLALSHAPGDF